MFVYLMTAVAHIRLRRLHPETETKAVRVWLFPWLSYLTIGGMVAVLVAMALTPALASQLYFGLLALAVAVVAYYVLRKPRAGDALSRSRRRAALPNHDRPRDAAPLNASVAAESLSNR